MILRINTHVGNVPLTLEGGCSELGSFGAFGKCGKRGFWNILTRT